MLKLGGIADDFTGATDLANNLVRAGMRVVQCIGVPSGEVDSAADAVVIALKSRTCPASEAVSQSLEAARWLHEKGARQIYFKVCSTFDSTPDGNIGPVAEALLEACGADFCCVTPAFPENGRSVYQGHLFVGNTLLSESGMRNHPLTPMTDANLVRVMQAQCKEGVGLVPHADVAAGSEAIRERIRALRQEGKRFGIVDAIADKDLLSLGAAIADAPLVVGGSGVALGLPQNFGLAPSSHTARLPPKSGAKAIVSGSCSVATNQQVADFVKRGRRSLAIDPLRIAAGDDVTREALQWATANLGDQPILIYSSSTPEAVKAIQAKLGVEAAGNLVENTLASIASGLVKAGVRQLVVAGGETSGAVIQALEIDQLQIGPPIDPGVPWCYSRIRNSSDGLHVALKSGNFGTTDFFTKSFTVLQ